MSSTFARGTFIGRVWSPEVNGPILVTVRDGRLHDVTSRQIPTVRDLLEMDDPVAAVRSAEGKDVGALEDLLSLSEPQPEALRLLAPIDLQAVKACGVTFARSMI